MPTMAPRDERYRLAMEPAESALPDDIEHWQLVYEELLTFLDEMLERCGSASASPQVRVLRNRREEFARRLRYWSDQADTSRRS